MSLRKPFKRGPVWYCEVDRRRVSLKTKDKAEALSRFAATACGDANPFGMSYDDW